jgi:hypothetical protein
MNPVQQLKTYQIQVRRLVVLCQQLQEPDKSQQPRRGEAELAWEYQMEQNGRTLALDPAASS